MSGKVNENRLLEGLDAYGAHADELESGVLNGVFAFRSFDMGDNFLQPFASFRVALEALQSPDAHMPELGSIVAYCRDGREFRIPDRFYIRKEPRFADRAAAEHWVRERIAAIESGSTYARIYGTAISNPKDPIEKQIKDAMAAETVVVVSAPENDQVCEQVARWLMEQLESSC